MKVFLYAKGLAKFCWVYLMVEFLCTELDVINLPLLLVCDKHIHKLLGFEG